MQNIYLLGMMGAGKTTVGKILAQRMQMNFVDLDGEIESQTHLTLNEIFRKKGEPFFRSEESRILDEITTQQNAVVATGGGVVLRPHNVAQMRSSGRTVYLSASFEALWNRVRGKRDRPLLDVTEPKAVFLAIFHERRPLYEAASHHTVEIEGLSPEKVARTIVEMLK